jgi:hypothetical protein
VGDRETPRASFISAWGSALVYPPKTPLALKARFILRRFGWQNGYGIFSIGSSQIEAERHYIAEQEQHHRKLSFQDEFRLLLRRYEVAYDERYAGD